MRAGIGVNLSMWIMDSASGRWPSRDPTKNNLDNTWRFREIWHDSMFNDNLVCHNKCGSCVSALPGCSYDWGVKASIAGQSHSNGDSPAHYTQSLICECLKSQTRWLEALSNLNIQLVRSFWFTYHCYCITGQYSTDIQNSIVCHIGEDINDGDNRHRNGNGQRQVPEWQAIESSSG